MAQARKRQVRSTRTNSKTLGQNDENTRPSAPAGTEEVGSDDEATPEADDSNENDAENAQDEPETDQNAGDDSKGDTYDYIDAEGRVKAEANEETPVPKKAADETGLVNSTDGKGFSGGERYTPPTGKVVPPKGRIIPVGGELTFDGMDFGTHIISTEDVYQEIIPTGSKRRSYVLKIRKGTTLPRTKYQNLTEG